MSQVIVVQLRGARWLLIRRAEGALLVYKRQMSHIQEIVLTKAAI